MALSDSHIKLVQALRSYVEDTYGANKNILIYTDNPDPNIKARVPKFDGFIPDLYARTISPDRFILGEAKTAGDVETRHSIYQYEQYLSYCACHLNSILLFAVPWTVVATLKNKIRIIKLRLYINNVNPIYIEPLFY